VQTHRPTAKIIAKLERPKLVGFICEIEMPLPTFMRVWMWMWLRMRIVWVWVWHGYGFKNLSEP